MRHEKGSEWLNRTFPTGVKPLLRTRRETRTTCCHSTLWTWRHAPESFWTSLIFLCVCLPKNSAGPSGRSKPCSSSSWPCMIRASSPVPFKGCCLSPSRDWFLPIPPKATSHAMTRSGGGCGWSLSIRRLSLREYRRQTMVSGRSGCGQQLGTTASRRWTVRGEGLSERMWKKPSWPKTWRLHGASCRM